MFEQHIYVAFNHLFALCYCSNRVQHLSLQRKSANGHEQMSLSEPQDLNVFERDTLKYT